jgi:peptide/nickel transport system substrate-binding protein
MKRIGLAVLIFAGLAFAAAQQAPAPVSGGTAVVAITAEPPGWDPTVSTSQEIARVTYHNIFEGLARIDGDGKIVPQLATSWKTSSDGLTWTFQLREGVKFQDGSPMTVDDVVAQFKRAMDPNSGHTHPEYYASIASVSGNDKGSTVTFKLKHADSSFLFNLARPDSIIYKAGTTDSQRTHPVGTGPFKFVKWVPGSEVDLEKWNGYYIKGEPYLDKLTFRIMPDPNTRFAALQSGDIDMIGTSLAPEDALKAQKDANLKVTKGYNTTKILLAMNNTRPPFNNLKVRQAITYAINKKAIVEGAMFGFGTIIGSHVTPIEPYFVNPDPYPYNPEKAKELLKEAGYPNGFTAKLELPQPYNIEIRTGQVIAQQLAQVGIKLNVSVVEWTTWLSRIFTQGDYDLTVIGHSEPRDISIYGNPKYYFHYDNPQVQKLLSEAEEAPNQDEAVADYKQVAETIAKDAVNVWIFNPSYLVAARKNLYGYWTNQPIVAIDMTKAYKAP